MRMGVAICGLLLGCGFRAPIENTGQDASPADAAESISDATLDAAADARPPDAGPPMFSYDFEGTLQGPFSGIYFASGDTVTHSTTAHTGTRSAKCETNDTSTNQATMYLDFSLRDELYVSMWVRLESGFPPAGHVRMYSVANDMGEAWVNIANVNVYPDMTVGVDSETDGSAAIHYSNVKLTSGSWHRIELWVKASSTDGRLALALDGAMQFDLTKDTGDLLFHRVLTGIAWQGDTNEPIELLIDDVVVD